MRVARSLHSHFTFSYRMIAFYASSRSFVVRPHTKHLNDLLFFYDFVNEAIQNIDSPRIRPGEIAYELFVRRRVLKRILCDDRKQRSRTFLSSRIAKAS
jgi:hypothetical protein